MIVDFSWSGGLVFGLNHTEEAVVETDEDVYEFANAVLLHLGFFTIAFIFVIGKDQQKRKSPPFEWASLYL